MKNQFGLILVISLIFTSIDCNAQGYPDNSFGIRGGANLNSWTNEFPALDTEFGPIFPEQWNATFGYHGGIYFNIRLSELVAIEPAFLYTLKGTGASLDDPAGKVEAFVKAGYVDASFLVRLYVADGFNLFLGPQLSYLVNAEYDVDVDGTTVIEGIDITDDLSELDAAAILGLGYEFENGFNINLGGELGFLTVDGFDQLSTFNRTIRLSLGYSF